MYFKTASLAVRFVGFSIILFANNQYITPENAKAILTQTVVQIVASLVFITCDFRLKTPKSNAKNKIMKAKKTPQTSISNNFSRMYYKADNLYKKKMLITTNST